MEAWFRSWWQQIKQHPFMTVGVVVALLAIIAFTLAVYMFGWDWTGFTGGESKITKTPQGTTAEYSPGKNLWDWMQLLAVLAIPVVVGFGAAWFTAQQGKVSDAENKDNQRERALQAYIDKISEFLLEKDLRKSGLGDEVRRIAHARTRTVLPSLNPMRKRSLLGFLYESRLIDRGNPIVDLHYANLGEANLRKVILYEADLRGAGLRDADLREADLREAYLYEAKLEGANLRGADLSEANLSKAIITTEQLKEAKSLEDATMPDGSIHQ